MFIQISSLYLYCSIKLKQTTMENLTNKEKMLICFNKAVKLERWLVSKNWIGEDWGKSVNRTAKMYRNACSRYDKLAYLETKIK